MIERRLRNSAIDIFSVRTLMYTATVQQGTTLADVLRPDFRSLVSPKLKQGTRIEVTSTDLTLDVELRVTRVIDVPGASPIVEVKPLRIGYVDGTPIGDAAIAAELLTVEFGGPRHKWRVKHGSKVVAFGLDSEAAARVKMDEMASAIDHERVAVG